jgi:hypothetical protein
MSKFSQLFWRRVIHKSKCGDYFVSWAKVNRKKYSREECEYLLDMIKTIANKDELRGVSILHLTLALALLKGGNRRATGLIWFGEALIT